MNRVNYVVSGEYKDKEIRCDVNMNCCILDVYTAVYFDKINVKSITKVNEHTYSPDIKSNVAFWFGALAAISMVDDVTDIIAKVEWSNGTESLICVRDVLYTNILGTSITNVEYALHGDQISESEKESKYKRAQNLMLWGVDVKDIKEASRLLSSLGDYKNASLELLVLGDYTNDIEISKYIKYRNATRVRATNEKDAKEKIKILEELGNYRDCKKILSDIGDYSNPETLKLYIDYETAYELFENSNSPYLTIESRYKSISLAKNMFVYLGDYIDAKSQVERCDILISELPITPNVNHESSSIQEKSSKQKGCYIATCVYGSYDCPQVWTLRRFRDNTLGSTWYGRAFIRTYYAISPTIVKWFGNTAWFKKMWRGTLNRMVKKLESNGVENTPYQDKNW